MYVEFGNNFRGSIMPPVVSKGPAISSEEVAAHTADYLAKGGKIRPCPPCIFSDTPRRWNNARSKR